MLTRHYVADAPVWVFLGSDDEEVSPTVCAKVLRGAQTNDLPVEQPSKIELWINLKTAKALDLTIPASLLATADEGIE